MKLKSRPLLPNDAWNLTFAEGQQSEEMEKNKNDAPVPKKSKQDRTNVYDFEAESQLPPRKQSKSSLREGMLASGVRSGIGEVTTADQKSNAQVIHQFLPAAKRQVMC